jgi:hypothetical protein
MCQIRMLRVRSEWILISSRGVGGKLCICEIGNDPICHGREKQKGPFSIGPKTERVPEGQKVKSPIFRKRTFKAMQNAGGDRR